MSIEAIQLTKKYGNQLAVDALDFSVEKGQIVGFLGPNGAGKSTTMKMLCTYLKPTSGRAIINGFDIEKQAKELTNSIGYLPELNPLYYDMFITEFLAFMAKLKGVARKDIKKEIAQVVDRVGLGPEKQKKIGQLSKGYKQRVGLAQALLGDPKLLILDEPTSGLDPNQVLQIRELISDFGREKTVLLSTHIMQEVEAICSQVMIINQGKIVEKGSLDDIKKKYSKEEQMCVKFSKPIETKNMEYLKQKGIQIREYSDQWIFGHSNKDFLVKEIFELSKTQENPIVQQEEIKDSLEDIFKHLTKK